MDATEMTEAELLYIEERAEKMYPESDTTYGYQAVREAFIAGWLEATADARSTAAFEVDYTRMELDGGRDGWL